MKTMILIMGVLSMTVNNSSAQVGKNTESAPIYNYVMKSLDGKERSLSDFKGKVVLIVNTASFCGYTPQYKDLESIYQTYKEKGFVVIGFPANNFGKQEPGSNDDIAAFCERNYGVSFPLFGKISVKGDDIHPFYKYLTTETPFKGEIEWNFSKFLVDKKGNVVARYAPKIKPTEREITAKIDQLLAQD